jgi:hypothetical protein
LGGVLAIKLPSSTQAAVASNAMIAFQQMHTLPSPPSVSARQTDLIIIRHSHATNLLALAIIPQHSVAPHKPTALNCLLCCCLLRAFLLVLLGHCILPKSFCTLQYATQNLHTQSNVLHHQHTAKKTSCVFFVTQLTPSLCSYHSFPSCARFQHYVSLILSWQEKRHV